MQSILILYDSAMSQEIMIHLVKQNRKKLQIPRFNQNQKFI